MKKLVLLSVLFAGTINFTYAQAALNSQTVAKQGETTDQVAKNLTDNMQTNLKLTADQHKQLYTVNYELAKKMKAVKGSDDAAAIIEARNYQATEYRKVLTDDQYAKFQQMKSNH